jgi:DNA-binding transcriptional ArsR family regulator
MDALPTRVSGIIGGRRRPAPVRPMAADSPRPCPTMQNLSPDALAQVAAYFSALAEPARLRLLNLLRDREASVGELAESTGYSAANVSRHLALLAQHGLLARQSRGTSVYYAIADPAIYDLCNLVCDNLARRFERTAPQRAAFERPQRREPGRETAPQGSHALSRRARATPKR